MLRSVLLLALVVAGCDKKNEAAGSGETAMPAVEKGAEGAEKHLGVEGAMGGGAAAAVAAAAKVERKKFAAAEIPSDLEIKGKIFAGLRFADKNGDNWVLFAKRRSEKDDSESEYLFVKHFAVGRGGTKELRYVRDKVEDCEFDLLLRLDRKSLDITDLDDDGIGEVIFAYELTCTSDVSPSTLKLLMIEGGDKYIIRGTTRVFDGTGHFGGEMRIDPSLENGPPAFLAHAKKLWPKLAKRN